MVQVVERCPGSAFCYLAMVVLPTWQKVAAERIARSGVKTADGTGGRIVLLEVRPGGGSDVLCAAARSEHGPSR